MVTLKSDHWVVLKRFKLKMFGVLQEALYIRLIEMYHIEDFEKLQDSLLRLFPSLNEDSPIDIASFKDFFENMAHRYMSVGRIFRKNDFCILPHCIINELPPEVDFIDVAMHKTVPSTIFITLDVHLTGLANQNLCELQRSKYLSEIKFTSLIPWKIKIHSVKHEDSVMKRQVLNWLISKRKEIEQCIRPYLDGFFMQQLNEQARLPAIDVYAIKGMSVEEKAFEEWRNNSRSWWDSFGFKFYADVYSNGELLFIGSDNASHSMIIPFDSGPPDDNDFPSDFMNSTLTCTALTEYLSSLQFNIEKLRNNVYTSMAKCSSGPHRLKRHFERHDEIRRESVFLERVSMEFGQHSDFIRHRMKVVEDYKIIKILPNEEDEFNLKDVLFDSVINKKKGLNKQLSLLSKSFTEYLGMRNMEAIYYLTRWMFWLTLITLITAVGPCIKGYLEDDSSNKDKSSENRSNLEGASPSPTEIRI